MEKEVFAYRFLVFFFFSVLTLSYSVFEPDFLVRRSTYEITYEGAAFCHVYKSVVYAELFSRFVVGKTWIASSDS